MLQIALKRLREASGLSQTALAKKMGVGQSTIGMWESGKNRPEYGNLQKLASIFEVPIWQLVDSDDSDDYSSVFRGHLKTELETIDPQSFIGSEEAEYDYHFLVNLSESSHPMSLSEACRAADYLGASMDEMLDWKKRIRKAPSTDEAVLGASQDQKIMHLVQTLNNPQKDFLIAYLETLVARGQSGVPVAPVSTGETTPGSEHHDQT